MTGFIKLDILGPENRSPHESAPSGAGYQETGSSWDAGTHSSDRYDSGARNGSYGAGSRNAGSNDSGSHIDHTRLYVTNLQRYCVGERLYELFPFAVNIMKPLKET